MSRNRDPRLQFIANFVDSVTVRPFMADLRRMKASPGVFGPLPREEQPMLEADEPAYAA